MKTSHYAARTYRQDDPVGGWLRATGLGVMLALGALWAATELAASRFGYQHALGMPLLPHLYAPWSGLDWELRFRSVTDPRARAVLAEFWRCAGGGIAVAFIVALMAGMRFSSRTRRGTDAHGSAHWASKAEVAASGLLGNADGVYVGAWQDSHGTVHYLRDDGPAHVLAFAPTRSGKGVGLVLPTLLSWPHSVVVHDIKGENFALTAGWRARDLDSRIVKFEPTAIDGSCARFNPLSEVRLRTPYEVQDVQNIVAMLCDPDGKGAEGDDAHWIVSAQALLLGLCLHELYAGKNASLSTVATVLSSPLFESTAQLFEHLLATEHDPDATCRWTDAAGNPTRTHPLVAMTARDMLNKSAEESGSIISTAVRFLTLFRDPIVAGNVAASDFTIRDLMHADRPLSLYIVIPPSDIDRLKPLTRLIFNQIVRTLTAEMTFADGRAVAGYRHRLLLMIDELPSLGRLDILQNALAYMAGYGIKSYLITQDVAQLQAAYGGPNSTETIMANCHVQVAYAPNKVETMELLSKLAGQATVRTEQRSYSGGRLGFRGNVQISVADTERPLLTPDEARRLPPGDALVFVAGHAPIYGRKITYYNDATFAERAKVALAQPA